MSDVTLTKQLVDNAARMALLIPLDDARALVEEIERTDTLMPLLDPTGYRAIMDTLPQHRAVAKAFLTFRQELEKLAVPA